MDPVRILKVSRLEGLVDGIFAIAMTILVLDLRLPPGLAFNGLLTVLIHDVLFKLIVYIGSFIILGTLWVAMNFQWGLLDRINRPYLWTNIFYLMVVCVVPFSASLVGEYPNSPASISFYAINLMVASLSQFFIFQCAHHYHLNREVLTPALRFAVMRRIFVAPIFYVGSLFAAHWNVHFAFFLLIAPTIIYMIPGRVDRFDAGLSK